MLIYLYGPDSYRRIKKQKEIIGEYKAKHSSLTIDRFYLEEDFGLWGKFKDFIKAGSLFGSKKMAVVSGFSAGDLTPAELSFLKSLSKDEGVIVLISEAKKLSARFDFLVKKPCLSQEFKNLTVKQFGNFLLKEAEERDIKLTNNLLAGLVKMFFSDSWGAVMELEKTALAGNPPLLIEHQPFFGDSIFNLIYELKSGNLKERITVLEILLKTEDPVKVFNLTAYSVNQKKEFADYDVLIKSGKLDYETALTDALIG